MQNYFNEWIELNDLECIDNDREKSDMNAFLKRVLEKKNCRDYDIK